MRTFLIVLLPLLIQASNLSYEKGRDLYFQKGCANCHGTEAEGNSYYPKLANRPKNHILKKLAAFKNGEADNQKQEIMFTFARSLNEEDMQNLATYLSEFQADTSDKYEISDDILGSMD